MAYSISVIGDRYHTDGEIFLPEDAGHYSCNTLYGNTPTRAYILSFGRNLPFENTYSFCEEQDAYTNYGFSVRCVKE